MNPDWTLLDRELTQWREAGLVLPLWWRDDDAIASTPALDRLADLAERLGLPVHLAVIPQPAHSDLADIVAAHRKIVPIVHGWAHLNHASEGEKNAEFGDHRPLSQMVSEANQALHKLHGIFSRSLVPMFVPPWNRITPELFPHLPALGYTSVSTFKPRSAKTAAAGLEQINTHLDPINWRSSKTLVDPDTLITQISHQLADRRLGEADNTEPYGILTHHLVHDEPIWSFTEQLLSRLLAGPVRVWTADPAKGDFT